MQGGSNPKQKACNPKRIKAPKDYILVWSGDFRAADTYGLSLWTVDEVQHLPSWKRCPLAAPNEEHTHKHAVPFLRVLDIILQEVLADWVLDKVLATHWSRGGEQGLGLAAFLIKHSVTGVLKERYRDPQGQGSTHTICMPWGVKKAKQKGNKYTYLANGKQTQKKTPTHPTYLHVYAGVDAQHQDVWMGVHVLMCCARHGNPPQDNYEVSHLCSHAWCLNPHHMKWATHKANMNHRTL